MKVIDYVIFLVITTVVGFLVGLFINWYNKKQNLLVNNNAKNLENELNELKQKLQSAEEKLINKNNEITKLTTELKHYFNTNEEQNKQILLLKATELNLAESNKQLEIQKVTITELKTETSNLKNKLEEKTENIKTLSTENEALKTKLDEKQNNFEEQLKQLNQAKEQIKLEYKDITEKLFEQSQQKVKTQNQQAILELLDPVKIQLKEFKERINAVHTEDTKTNQALVTKIEELAKLNKKITDEAKNLTAALKGDNKTQGNWGEIKLQRLLEEAGLEKDLEYKIQDTITNENSNILRPDVVLTLPEEKQVIIDSKVNLKDYEAYSSEDNPETKQIYLKKHIESIKNQIKNLASKNYQDAYGIKTFDLVLMFIPIEPAYHLALENERSLFTDALNKRILIVSPSMLLVTLRMIKEVLRHDKQNKNIEEIAKRGATLYEKIVGLVESFEKVGENIKRAQKSYDDTIKRLSGKGGAIRQAEMLKELGVKSKKSFSQDLLENPIESSLNLTLPSSNK